MNKVDQQIARALDCARTGDHARAEKIAKAVLAADATNFDALQIYGSACLERGDLRTALHVLLEAVRQDPRFPPVQMNIANCGARMGKHEAALAHFDEALRLRPDYPAALYNRALSLKELGRTEEAAADIARAMKLAPDEPKILSAYTQILVALGRTDEVQQTLAAAVSRNPRAPEVLASLGSVLFRIGRRDDALRSFETAISIDPANATLHRRLADALAELGDDEEAVQSYTRAIELSSDDPETFEARAAAFMRLGRIAEAEADQQKAFETYDRNSVIRYERGNVEGALKDNLSALRIQPRSLAALVTQGTLRAYLRDHRGAFESRAASLEVGDTNSHRLAELCTLKCRLCEWSGLADLVDELRRRVAAHETLGPWYLLPLIDDPALHMEAAEWTRHQSGPAPKPRPLPKHPFTGRLHIGYFSADFRSHPVLQLIGEVFRQHNRERFHVSGFSLTRVKDAVHQRIRSSFDDFHDVYEARSEDITLLARKQRIDIAIDLTGYTFDCRPEIFARRAAAIQVNFLGYPGTMGADFMDYIIADPVVIPPELRQHYAEKVAYMPFSCQPNDRLRPIEETSSRTAHGLPEQGFVFCCFNDTYKILSQRFDTWARILQRVNGSVLWLAAADKKTEENFRREASARGVEPERLVFAPRLPTLGAHLARHRLADLFLDTAPYNAHTTASDALWAGLPVLTRMGQAFQARVAASLLATAGVPELITTSDEEYENLAVRLATDPALLAAVKKKVMAARTESPLFDVKRFTRDLERLYEEMMRRHHAGLPPEHIVLPGA